MSRPSVTIIVLNYKSYEDTIACLHSLEHLTYSHAQVLVVDNGSANGSIEAIRAAYPDVWLIDTGANLGFTGGNNVGVKAALEKGADYILLLNNDTIVAPDMLDVMVEVMENDKSIGVTGPTIYYYDAPETIWSAGGEINWKHGTTRMIGLDEEDKGQFGLSPLPVDFVTGCALMARRDVWEKAGLLDDNFFMYYEETEWCVRARRAGCQIAYVPMAMMWHKISTQQRAASPRTYYYMTRNRLLFLRNTRAGVGTWLNIAVEYGRTWLSWTLRSRWEDKRPLRSVMLRAIHDFSRQRFGQASV
jgi:GT2 family glycosyltransferase